MEGRNQTFESTFVPMTAEQIASEEAKKLKWEAKQAATDKASASAGTQYTSSQRKAPLAAAPVISPAELAEQPYVHEFASSGVVDDPMEFLVAPWIPLAQVIGMYGQGQTAKSTLCATIAAQVSNESSTLWATCEEPAAWVVKRHEAMGGEKNTIYVWQSLKGKDGKLQTNTFDIFKMLEGAIVDASAKAMQREGGARPLRFVVLDTAVGLHTWGKGESSNNDGPVKKLMAHLLMLSTKYRISIVAIGHGNKTLTLNPAHMVSGSGSWTTSTRTAYMLANKGSGEYEGVICSIKHSNGPQIAQNYRTVPVLTLMSADDQAKAPQLPTTLYEGETEADMKLRDVVLCKVEMQGAYIYGNAAKLTLLEALKSTMGSASDMDGDDPDKSSAMTEAVNTLISAADTFTSKGTKDAKFTRAELKSAAGMQTVQSAWWQGFEKWMRLGDPYSPYKSGRGAHGKKNYTFTPLSPEQTSTDNVPTTLAQGGP